MLGRLLAQPKAANATASAAVLIGLAGRGIQLSRSPIMHEREGARLGISYSYVLIDFDRLGLPDSDLGGIIAAAEQMGFAGLNITHPFKQSVIQYLGWMAPEAAAIGAVNTVVFANGVRQGHNTDAWGFAESFCEGMADCSLERVVQFGAGGAGAAVAYTLMELGVGELHIIDNDGERARELAQRMTARFGKPVVAETDVAGTVMAADGIVNTTPVGMAKYPGVPFPSGLLRTEQWVAEIIYFPEETELLRKARALGCRALAGTGMAVYQAVRAFELFTGIAPDRAAMAGHFEAMS
ncbi:shikimate dehydrogenase [Aminobacter sp. AP02]|uniref:shikimate dehydrogenase n=1 Tax=Aminobacter sp. AP02 TaxID=2135737 RepID=UPI000D6BAC16|nr:shikimate dehydrogenase [Aminobacter sp. AP02]